MHTPELQRLAAQSRAPRVAVTPELDTALTWLDEQTEALAQALEVEYVGPGVGTDPGAEAVYRLVVRCHEWRLGRPTWSVKVCDATPEANYRATWPIPGVQRLRKQRLVQVLPEFLSGWSDAVSAAGKGDSEPGRRLAALARAFTEA